MATKFYYAVQYMSGRQTTIGQPNEKTGRLSKAVHTHVFTSKEERDHYVNNGSVTADMRGNCREAVTRKQLRDMHLGMSLASFNEWLESIQYVAEYE